MAQPTSSAQGLGKVMVSATLLLIFILGFASRLFLTLRYAWLEVNEFDPMFQARVTKFMAEEGWHAFLNFFDLRSWYPLGRATGPTLYPGLMITSSLIYWALGAINVPINIRLVMHFLPPLFTGFTSIACFLLGRAAMLGPQSSAEEKAESERRRVKADAVGLLAAAFAAIVPGYAQRSVAGAYDNEAIAIFALVLTFYLWVKAVNTGSLAVAVGSALAYFYMVSAWGGYIFILNLIPMHVLALMIAGRYSARLYIAYSTFYVVGTLLSMQIPFVGFQPVYSSEHLPALGVFGLVQLAALNAWLRAFFASDGEYARVRSSLLSAAAALFCLAAVVGSVTGYIAPWTGRLWSLLDPTYAKNNIPIIASVAEHQPTSWSSYFSDFHILSVLMPAGFYFLLQRPTDGGIFLVVYGIVGAYFSGVMIRLILTLAPAMCVLGAVAVQEILEGHVPAAAAYVRSLLAVVVPALAAKSAAPAVADASSTSASSGGGAGPAGAAPLASPTGKKTGARAAAAQATRVSRAQRGLFATVATAAVAALLALYVKHSVWFISEGYSSPSIVMIARTHTGDRKVFDDYREAYSWLRQNTPEDAKIVSWWDYGYQMAAMANRTVIVDNNTWNNTHIATVGKAMVSSEEEAYPIFKSLDADYVLVVFGGFAGYAGDDINKVFWMWRISGGVFPEVPREAEFLSPRDGQLRVDRDASPTFAKSLMYRLSYHRFGEVYTDMRTPPGFDRVRNQEILHKNITLTYFEEAFTSQHWMLRIYKRVDPGNTPGEERALPKPPLEAAAQAAAAAEDWHTAVRQEGSGGASGSAASASKARKGKGAGPR